MWPRGPDLFSVCSSRDPPASRDPQDLLERREREELVVSLVMLVGAVPPESAYVLLLLLYSNAPPIPHPSTCSLHLSPLPLPTHFFLFHTAPVCLLWQFIYTEHNNDQKSLSRSVADPYLYYLIRSFTSTACPSYSHSKSGVRKEKLFLDCLH